MLSFTSCLSLFRITCFSSFFLFFRANSPLIKFSYSANSLRNATSVAYEKVLAPHHGWAIRKAVAAGMYALPSKFQLLKRLNEDGTFFYTNFLINLLFFQYFYMLIPR
jgi:Glycolipid transfer protein (GLTP)